MQVRILIVLDPSPLKTELHTSLKEAQHQIFAPENKRDTEALLTEGPWDVVIAQVESQTGLPDDVAVLASALTSDLFTQVVYLGVDLTVRTAVELMRAGAWSVVDTSAETLSDILLTVEQAIQERREDLELVKATEG